RRKELEERHPGLVTAADAAPAEGAVVAVKPGDVEAACGAIGRVGADRVLSIAAGVPLARLEGWLPDGVPVVRAMPNPPALLVAEALIDAGVLAGLSRPVSEVLVVQTLLGSARLLAETGQSAETLRAAVTSPGGTTAAGLRALEASGVRSALFEAVMAAAERS